jgi:hypothetical protein
VGLAWRLHRVRAVYSGSPQIVGGSAGGDGIQARREALKREIRDMIEVLALGGREGPMDVQSCNGELHVLTKMPL